jgi:hypothetical protein
VHPLNLAGCWNVVFVRLNVYQAGASHTFSFANHRGLVGEEVSRSDSEAAAPSVLQRNYGDKTKRSKGCMLLDSTYPGFKPAIIPGKDQCNAMLSSLPWEATVRASGIVPVLYGRHDMRK